jgi:hypothetical protein
MNPLLSLEKLLMKLCDKPLRGVFRLNLTTVSCAKIVSVQVTRNINRNIEVKNLKRQLKSNAQSSLNDFDIFSGLLF